MEIIQPTQYAVFLRDAETQAPLTSDGHYLDRGMTGSCLIFDSPEETEQGKRSSRMCNIMQLPTPQTLRLNSVNH